MRRNQLLLTALAHAFLVLFCIATLYPVLLVLKTALSATPSLGLSGSPIPDEVTLQNFSDVVSTTDMQGRWLFGRQLLGLVELQLAGLAFAAIAEKGAVGHGCPVSSRRSMPSLIIRLGGKKKGYSAVT